LGSTRWCWSFCAARASCGDLRPTAYDPTRLFSRQRHHAYRTEAITPPASTIQIHRGGLGVAAGPTLISALPLGHGTAERQYTPYACRSYPSLGYCWSVACLVPRPSSLVHPGASHISDLRPPVSRVGLCTSVLRPLALMARWVCSPICRARARGAGLYGCRLCRRVCQACLSCCVSHVLRLVALTGQSP
jgi:hypothetical protein